jgi:hypothetical protein
MLAAMADARLAVPKRVRGDKGDGDVVQVELEYRL